MSEASVRSIRAIVTHRRVRTVKRSTDTGQTPETSQRAVVSHAATTACVVSLPTSDIRRAESKSALTYYHKRTKNTLYTNKYMMEEAGVITTGVPDLTKAIFISNDRIMKLADALANYDPFIIGDKPDRDGYLQILGEIGDIWPESVLEEAA